MLADPSTPWRPLPNPTQWIRVFELLPSPIESTIHLRLHNKQLSSRKPHYSAISYTWGIDETDVEQVTLDGTPYYLRRNLWSCLKRLRRLDVPCYLWADAICINQEDLIEKSHQVSIIGPIFRRAQKVLLWLGEATDGNDVALQTAVARDWSKLGKYTPEPSEKNHAVATEILSRPYWKRTWIIQEVFVAKKIDVLYGSCHTTWQPLRFFVGRCSCSGTPGEDEYVKIISQRANYRGHVMRDHYGSLEKNLRTFRDTQCTDPHDKVYALLSISHLPAILGGKRKGTSGLAVDYTLDLRELYCQTLEIYTLPLSNEVSFGNDLRNALGLTEEEVAQYISERGGLKTPNFSLFTQVVIVARGMVGIAYMHARHTVAAAIRPVRWPRKRY